MQVGVIQQNQWITAYPDQKLSEEKNVELRMEPDGVRVAETPLGNRLICRTTDGIRLVQLSGRFIAVNQLKPYPGWEEAFRDTIVDRVGEVQSEVGPMAIARTGLRYINRIEIPQSPLVWEDWFSFSLPVPTSEESRLTNFQMHFEEELPERCKLLINCMSVPSPKTGTSSVILDLDVVWKGEPEAPAQLPFLLERVHAPHRLAFEAYITDTLRKTFS